MESSSIKKRRKQFLNNIESSGYATRATKRFSDVNKADKTQHANKTEKNKIQKNNTCLNIAHGATMTGFSENGTSSKRARSQREVKLTWKFKEYCANSKTDSSKIPNHTPNRKDKDETNSLVNCDESDDSKCRAGKSRKRSLRNTNSAQKKKSMQENDTEMVSSQSNDADCYIRAEDSNSCQNSHNLRDTHNKSMFKGSNIEVKKEVLSSDSSDVKINKEVKVEQCKGRERKTSIVERKKSEVIKHDLVDDSDNHCLTGISEGKPITDSISSTKEFENIQHTPENKGNNKICKNNKASSMTEFHNLNETVNSRWRKRKTISNTHSETIEVIRLPDLVVKLEDYPESYCTEVFKSFDKNRSLTGKQCERFLCKLCGSYRTIDRDQLEKHISLHVNHHLDCHHDDCYFVANSLYNLGVHLRKVHREGKFVICELCGSEFNENRAYKEHLSKVHKEAVYKCVECNNKYLSNKEYREHVLKDHSHCAFKCENCSEIFFSKKLLENHQVNKICMKSSYKCKYCGVEKKSQHRLQEHIKRVHSKEQRFKCTVCPYATSMNYLLKQHMRAHLGIHPHKCELCKFSCVKKWQLVSHMRTHTNEKCYKCDQCSYAAAWNVQLKAHIKAHESPDQQLCQICNIVFKDQRCFARHYTKEHSTWHRTPKVTVPRQNDDHPSLKKYRSLTPVEGTNIVVCTDKEFDAERETGPNNEKDKTVVDILKSSEKDTTRTMANKNLDETQQHQQNKISHLGNRNQLCKVKSSEVNLGSVAVSRHSNINSQPVNYTPEEVDSHPETPVIGRLSTMPEEGNEMSVVSVEKHGTDQSYESSSSSVYTSQCEILNQEKTKDCFTQCNTLSLQESESEIVQPLQTNQSEFNLVSASTGTVQSIDSQSVGTVQSIDSQSVGTVQSIDSQSVGTVQSIDSQSVGTSMTLSAGKTTDVKLLNTELSQKVTNRPDAGVTFLQVHVNSDGTRRYEIMDPKTLNASLKSTSQNRSVISTISDKTALSQNTLQNAHNYATPEHKQRKSSSRLIPQSIKHVEENELSIKTTPTGKQTEYMDSNNKKEDSQKRVENVNAEETTTYIVNLDEPNSIEVATYQVIAEGGEMAEDELQEIIITPN